MAGLFKKLGQFFAGLLKADTPDYQRVSRFAHFLDGVAEDSPSYVPGHTAVVLCDESLGLVSRRLRLTEQLRKASDATRELECYNNLTEEDAARLKDLCERHKSLTRDKSTLQNQATSYPIQITKVADLEERAPAVLRDMQDAERSQRAFRQDVAALQGEKVSLEDEYERMISAMELTRKLTSGLVVVFAAAAIILALLFVAGRTWVLIPAIVAVIAVIIMSALVYALRRRLRWEMGRNVQKRQKAVGMLNRKSVVYAHYTSFLGHQYKKYAVRNAAMLKRNIKDFESCKHLVRRLDAVRSILYQTEEELEKLLKDYGIPNAWPTYGQFIDIVNVADKKAAYRDAETRKKTYEAKLAAVETQQARIWLELDQLAAEEPLAAKVVSAYMGAAERMMSGKDFAPLTEDHDEETIGEELQSEH